MKNKSEEPDFLAPKNGFKWLKSRFSDTLWGGGQKQNNIIKTNRLILRPFMETDVEDVWKNFGSSETVYQYLPWEYHKNIEETKKIVHRWVERNDEHGRYYWCIDLQETVKAIGAVYLVNYEESNRSLEAGFCLGEQYWGLGIMPEALNAVCEYIESLGHIDYIWGRHSIENPASGKVFQKSYFIFEKKELKYRLGLKRETEVIYYKRMCKKIIRTKKGNDMGKSQTLYSKAKTMIPGGTQLLSKRPEMFLPDYWPAYYKKAKGCYVWDLDDNKYMDASYMGIGANVLGYADDDVDEAVRYAVSNGSMCTLNAPEEVELAEKIIELHPWAEKVRYAKTGGEALAIAVRIARASTRRDVILFCGYHGWSDWYLAANLNQDTALDGHLIQGLEPLGVPRGLLDTAYPFQYNDTKEFLQLVEKYKGRIAAVVLESVRNINPEKGFIDTIREITQKEGIVLIADEVSAGFRLNCGGAHMVLGFEPDMAVLAKALGNGYPMSVVFGKSRYMESAQSTFISSTYWTERIGLCAALAMMKKYQKEHVEQHLCKIGEMVQKGWKDAAEKQGILLKVSGIPPLAHFEFAYENSLAIKTYFTQEMLKKGFLATNAFYASYAHEIQDIQNYLIAVDEVFEQISKMNIQQDIMKYLDGPVCQTGFQRLT